MEVYEKYIMQKFFIPPYFLLFFEGVLQSIVLAIGWIILYLSPKDSIRKEILNYDSMTNNLFYIPLFVVYLGLNIVRIHTIFIYTPVYRYVADIAVIFYLFIFSFFEKNEMSIQMNIIFLVCYLLIIFGILVFQEIIVINAFGLNKDTQKQIY